MKEIDPDNPVVKLCAAGMQAEFEGRHDDARSLFMEAWTASQDDFDACVAAHYVARHQESPEDTLRWNQEALDRAGRVEDDRVQSFFPSLYLNLGHSHEVLGNRDEASRCYELAAQRIDDLPAGPSRDLMQNAIARGRMRISRTEPGRQVER